MYKIFFKRFFDIVISGSALLLLSPIMLITAILVKIKLGSPVIFKQKRPGKYERIFDLYKFRTMTDRTDDHGNMLPDEERLTRFGKMLRSTSLDELPELVNILKGEMSIVGPRPLLVRYLPYYTDEERARHSVRPGLTGLAQINGRNNVSWDERLSLDVKYVRNITFKQDLNIFLQTFLRVIKRSDVASGEELKMQDLDVERADMEERHEKR